MADVLTLEQRRIFEEYRERFANNPKAGAYVRIQPRKRIIIINGGRGFPIPDAIRMMRECLED